MSNRVTRAFGRHPTGWAVTVLVVVALGLTLDVVLLLTAPELDGQARRALWEFPCTALPYGLAGALLIRKRPDLPFGWLLGGAAAGLCVSLAGVSSGNLLALAGHTNAWVAVLLSLSSLAFLPIAVQGLINLRFPSGTLSNRWERGLQVLLVIGTVGVMAGGVLGGDTTGVLVHGASPVPRPFAGTWLGTIGGATVAFAPLVVLLGIVAGLGVLVRCARAEGLERQQLKWRAAGVVVSLTLFPLAVAGSIEWANFVDGSLFVGTLVIPVLRHRLWLIDTAIRRSTAYAVTTAMLVPAFIAVTVLGAQLASRQVASSVATVVVAFAVVPAWQFSRDVVDRTFYGRRGDRYRALADVARRLDDVAGAGVLAAVVQAVASTLRLPYVAIVRPLDGEVLAATGAPVPGVATENWELTYRSVPVGRLVASPRRGEPTFDERDRSVIADIARQAGPAVQAEALTGDLLRARQRLVTAREDDRRRLRRDLHDGLGPALTGLGLTLDAARAAVHRDADKTEKLIAQAKDATGHVLSELRQTVYDLRPPVLDDLGLVGAVSILARRLAADAGIRVDVVDEGVPDLPAAVEVAAYRAAIESVTNVVRHAAAGHCCVRLHTDRDDGGTVLLVVDVLDDGSSAVETWRPGVGLTAMRERAEELGGILTAGSTASGGHVQARYPLAPVS